LLLKRQAKKETELITILYLGAEVGALAAGEVFSGIGKIHHVAAENQEVKTAMMVDAYSRLYKVRILRYTAFSENHLLPTTGVDHRTNGVEPDSRHTWPKTFAPNITPAAELSGAMACV
jgi:hypothetical protein